MIFKRSRIARFHNFGVHYFSKYLRATRISIYYGLLQNFCWAFCKFFLKYTEFWADGINEEKSRVSLNPKSNARVPITWGPPGSNVTVVVSPLLPTWGSCQFFSGRGSICLEPVILAVMIFLIDWPWYIAGYCLGSRPLSCNGSNHCWEKLSTPHIICCFWHWANMKAPSNITKQPNYVDWKQNLALPQPPTITSRKTKYKTTNTIKPSFNEGNQNLAQQQQKRYR